MRAHCAGLGWQQGWNNCPLKKASHSPSKTLHSMFISVVSLWKRCQQHLMVVPDQIHTSGTLSFPHNSCQLHYLAVPELSRTAALWTRPTGFKFSVSLRLQDPILICLPRKIVLSSKCMTTPLELAILLGLANEDLSPFPHPTYCQSDNNGTKKHAHGLLWALQERTKYGVLHKLAIRGRSAAFPCMVGSLLSYSISHRGHNHIKLTWHNREWQWTSQQVMSMS